MYFEFGSLFTNKLTFIPDPSLRFTILLCDNRPTICFTIFPGTYFFQSILENTYSFSMSLTLFVMTDYHVSTWFDQNSHTIKPTLQINLALIITSLFILKPGFKFSWFVRVKIDRDVSKTKVAMFVQHFICCGKSILNHQLF